MNDKPRAPHWAFVAPATAQRIRALLGTRADDAASLLFTAFLLQSPRRRADDDTPADHVMAPHEEIQRCRGINSNAHTKGEASGPWLADYCTHVGTSYVDYKVPGENGQGGKRRLVSVGFLESLRTRPERDARATYVHVATGLSRSAYAEEERILFANEIQRAITSYIESLPRDLYTPEEHAFERALSLCDGARDDNDIRAAIVEGRPYYAPAASGNTERLHAAGYTAMRGAPRRALWPYWVELDLVSAYAGCFARLAETYRIKMPILNSLLLTGDAWLAACASLKLGPEHRTAIKGLAIEALFGKAQKNLREECKVRGLATNIPHSPLFSELIRGRNELCNIAVRDGSLKGPGGRKNSLKTTSTALLHSVCSDYELQLIFPVYEVATRFRDKGCYVLLHQHDGVATGAPDDQIGDEFVSECQAAVAARAAALGVRTRLERKVPPPFRMAEALLVDGASAAHQSP